MRRMRLVGLAAVLALVGVACGGDDDGGAVTSPTATGAGNAVKVMDATFEPKAITVTAGTEVVWTQDSTQPHSVTADDGSFNSHPDCTGADASKCMKDGDEFKKTFSTAGTFAYYCVVHGGKGGVAMAGTVTVTA